MLRTLPPLQWARLCPAHWVLVILLIPSPLAGDDLEVTVEWARPTAEVGRPAHVFVEAVRKGESSEAKTALGGTTVPGTVVLPADTGTWIVGLRFDSADHDYWAEPVVVEPDTVPSRQVRLRVWPTWSIEGSMQADNDEELAELLGATMTARFWRAQDSRSCCRQIAVKPSGEGPCFVDSSLGRFECALPKAELDVRLRSEGFAAHHLWALAPGDLQEKDLSTLRFVRGASLVGWVVAANGGEVAGAELRLFPGESYDFDVRRRLVQVSHQAIADEYGFFQFAGLEPGIYSLEAVHPSYGKRRVDGIDVLEELEASLIHPVELQPPAELSLVVDPPRDSHDRPWRGLLVPAARDARPGPPFSLDEGGTYVRDEIDAGRHVLQLMDSRSSVYYSQTIEVDGDTFLPIQIPMVTVLGEVLLGDRPVEAEVRFGPPENIRMRTTEGEFSGWLPREGSWSVEVVGLELDARRRFRDLEVKAREGTARLRLELHDTLIRGQVVTQNGSPVERALVVVRAAGVEDDMFNVETGPDDEGHFEVRGLPVGTVFLSAHTETEQSAEIALDVEEGLELPDQRLVLRPRRIITGRLVGPFGPVPGVEVKAANVGGGIPWAWAISDRSDALGQFRLRVPGESARLFLWIYPVGYSFRTMMVDSSVDTLGDLFLDRNGGTLTLEFPAGRRDEVTVFHRGSPMGLGTLGTWLGKHPGQGGLQTETTIRVPNMEAGRYEACLVAQGSADYFAIFVAGVVPRRGCESAVVPSGGEAAIRLRGDGDHDGVRK